MSKSVILMREATIVFFAIVLFLIGGASLVSADCRSTGYCPKTTPFHPTPPYPLRQPRCTDCGSWWPSCNRGCRPSHPKQAGCSDCGRRAYPAYPVYPSHDAYEPDEQGYVYETYPAGRRWEEDDGDYPVWNGESEER